MSGQAKVETSWRTRHIDVPLGIRIMELRGRAGLNRTALAKALRISTGLLQHLEEGETRFSAAQIWQICGILQVEVAEIYQDLSQRIWADRAEYERWASRASIPGMPEEDWGFEPAPTARPDIQALAKASQRLTAEQVAMLIGAAKAAARSKR